MEVKSFPELELELFQSAFGSKINEEFVIPSLKSSKYYDRLTGFFTAGALVAIADGVEALIQNDGRMRLILGIHDVSEEVLAACEVAENWTTEVVKKLTQTFMEQIGRIKHGLERDRLEVVSWLLAAGKLQIKVAAPASRELYQSKIGIFHSKRLIFHDHHGNSIVGIGSQNETLGSNQNIEDMMFSASWLSPGTNTQVIRDFENIWDDLRSDVSVVEISEVLLTLLSNQFEKSVSIDENNSSRENIAYLDILECAQSSPVFGPFNLTSACLYPHQERVYMDALSRWPIRVMLADEVGLGKTLEAGMVIAYLLRYGKTEQVTIFAPAGLIRQWQEEMKTHFGLNFYVWNSNSKNYETIDGAVVRCRTITTPIEGELPSLRIISAQLARAIPGLIKEIPSDLVVVDEAHSARLHAESGEVQSTKMWKLIDGVKDATPNLLLLTATPIQIDPIEFHGLLRLLGLTEPWDDFAEYMRSLNVLADENLEPDMQTSLFIGNLLLVTVRKYSWLPKGASQQNLDLLSEVESLVDASSIARATFVRQNWGAVLELLALVHPAHLLTIRNTKTELEKFGYQFPRRIFKAPALKIPAVLADFLEELNLYLSSCYGSMEAALYPEKVANLGYARSTYYQRVVSSLTAAEQSLVRRLEKIRKISEQTQTGEFLTQDIFSNDNDLIEESLDSEEHDWEIEIVEVSHFDTSTILNLKNAIAIEKVYVENLLKKLEELPGNPGENDPKFVEGAELLEKLLIDGPVLVFSRYTDTLFGFVDYVRSKMSFFSDIGSALYTGTDVWLEISGSRVPSDKTGVKRALDEGKISVVFCSDAASEGLNLQSAKSIINLDVPWNPARLEQRIGRIARLGQTSLDVTIVNLWYPHSIEARMYARLLERHDLYQLAVGEFPDIFSKAISAEVVNELHTGSSSIIPDPEGRLQAARRSIQRIALQRIWTIRDFSDSPAMLFRQKLAKLARSLDSDESSTSLKTDSEITLQSSNLAKSVSLSSVHSHEFYKLAIGDVPIAFAVKTAPDRYSIVKDESLPSLLSMALGESVLTIDDYVYSDILMSEISEWWPGVINSYRWLPKHDFAKTLTSFEVGVFPNYSDSAAVELSQLGIRK